MEIITSAASTALANIVLAVIALAGAYAVYYIRLAGAQVKAQTKKIEDESARALLEDALDDVERPPHAAMYCPEASRRLALSRGRPSLCAPFR